MEPVMKPDYLMIAAGCCAFVAAIVAGLLHRTSRKQLWIGVCLWSLFGVGLLIRGFAPNLQIQENKFRISQNTPNQQMNPKRMVEQERQMQFLAALLTGASVIGLAIHYRTALFGRPGVPSGANVLEGS
jgi:hypothetical protein